MVLNRMFKKRKQKLKQHIKIMQNRECITIEGFLGNLNYKVKGLLFYLRDDEEVVKVVNEKDNNHFAFNIDLLELKSLITIDEGIFNLSLIVSVHKSDLTEKQLEGLKFKTTTHIDEETDRYEYPIRLGRFYETETITLRSAVINEKQIKLYKTVNGNISLAVNKTVNQVNKTQIDYLKSGKNMMHFGGKLFTRTYQVEHIDLIAIGRENNIKTKLPVTITHMVDETKKKFGLNRYKYEVKLNLNQLFENNHLNEDIYDLYFDIKFEDAEENVLVRVGKPRFRARYNLKFCRGENENKVFAVSPYYTFRFFNLSLQVDKFEKDVYKYLKKVMRWSTLIRLFNRHKNVWLVGERAYTAQDTGYHLFKYLRETYPNKNVYYIIEKDSPEAKNVEQFGNVVYFKSKEHIKLTVMATRIIGSHHPDYLFPLRTKEFESKVKAKKVFIQHGVMGTKNMVANYGKNAPGFDTDLFLVSSKTEQEMIVNDFNYDLKDVSITGLSRFDSLFLDDVKIKRQLLIIPTWREWLVRDDLFLDSEYYERYKDLVYNQELHELASKYNFEIIFCLHSNMQKFSHYFQEAPVRVINQGEIDVQRLLKESAMMITDYSSVAFDFSFLEKPIIYYQFDREQFIGKRGSHLDLDNDLPGDIVFELTEIAPLIKGYVKSDFKMKDKNKIKASRFIKYKDKNSSERIYQTIENDVRKKTFYQKAFETELYKVLFNRFRKSKYYFPAMKLFYNTARRFLPVDEKLILFESGLGRQYADSPKCIYEEIVNRNLDYKKVWVCNKRIRFDDLENTIRITRLSPSYYYYLAKAKVWVNNQNFPTYIKKRKQTTYLQTWHGTPLKKMLYDIDNVMGRSEGYVERVSSAVKNWDHLISPSKYASNAFRSAFKYDSEILEVGYPRNDIFYQEEKNELAKKVKMRLNIPKDKKAILYAPTFRDNQATKENRFTFDIEMDLHKMQAALGDEYIVLLRMHVVVTNKTKLDEELQGFVMDVSNYSDMQELLLITDLLITDYSSVMFDFANTKKPMLFFTYDLETYRDDVRGFYIDFENEAPGPLVRNTDEIIHSIENLDNVLINYSKKYNDFYEKYCSLEDGKASKRVVDEIFI